MNNTRTKLEDLLLPDAETIQQFFAAEDDLLEFGDLNLSRHHNEEESWDETLN